MGNGLYMEKVQRHCQDDIYIYMNNVIEYRITNANTIPRLFLDNKLNNYIVRSHRDVIVVTNTAARRTNKV